MAGHAEDKIEIIAELPQFYHGCIYIGSRRNITYRPIYPILNKSQYDPERSQYLADFSDLGAVKR